MLMPLRSFQCLLLMVSAVAYCGNAFAQWKEQTFTLTPGWNAVFLEVDPAPNDCATVFAGLPIESVWAWNRRFETVQFVRNASELKPEDPEWLVYFDASGANAGASTLFAVHSRPLLIKLAGDQPRTWTVKGIPSIQSPDWISNSFNLVGFPLDTDAPTFTEFFSADAALAGQPVHQLDTDGRWKPVANPATEKMRSGGAYWVYCDGTSSYAGGVEVQPELGAGLFYGQSLVEQVLTLRNTTTVARTVSLALQPSAAAPSGESTVAGGVELYYYEFDGGPVWKPLAEGHSVSVPAGQEVRIRLETRRSEFSGGGAGGEYQSLLRIANGGRTAFNVPVTATGIGEAVAKGMASHPRAGLWIGTVAVNKTNFVSAASAAERAVPVPTASEFQFRILIHVDAGGTARLLQEVIQMWKPGTTNPDGSVAEPGEFVLLTDDSRIGEFEGATLRDGTPAGRRFSSAAFGFETPIEMGGSFPAVEAPATSVSGDVVLAYDDPLNPFYHRYHPDHDNLNFNFEPYTGNVEQESYTVTRSLTLDFTEGDPEGLNIAGWGDTQIGGIYRESIQGLHKDLLTVEGFFRLQHASRIASLNGTP